MRCSDRPCTVSSTRGPGDLMVEYFVARLLWRGYVERVRVREGMSLIYPCADVTAVPNDGLMTTTQRYIGGLYMPQVTGGGIRRSTAIILHRTSRPHITRKVREY